MRRTHTTVNWTTLSEGDKVEVQGHPSVPDGTWPVTELDDPAHADEVPVRVQYPRPGGYTDNHWIRATDIVRVVNPAPAPTPRPHPELVQRARVIVVLANFGVNTDDLDIEALAEEIVDVLR